MTLKKTPWFGLTLGLFLAISPFSSALAQSWFFAEPGNWWDTARPGEGLVLERQGNVVGLILFTYTASGEPEFYIATGEISSSPSINVPPIIGAGTSSVDGTLYRFKNGPVFNSDRSYFAGDPPANEAEPVGTLRASISPFSNVLRVRIHLDEDKVPEGAEQTSDRRYRKSTFGYGGFGRYDDSSAPLQASRACWVDLRGRWVFVDRSTAVARNAWSFNFTEVETSPAPGNMSCPEISTYIRMDHVLTYRDPQAGATLRCVTKDLLPTDPAYQPEFWRCVLRTNGDEALLWFSVHDAGAKEISATLGEPPDAYYVWRGIWEYYRPVSGLRVD